MEKKSVLIIDHEADFGKMLKWTLEDETGHVGFVASSGHEAVELIHEKKIDFVILDRRIPDMDGFDVLRLIRALKPKVPVAIMMSVWSEKEARLAFSFGAQDCVPKSKSIAKIKNGLLASLI